MKKLALVSALFIFTLWLVFPNGQICRVNSVKPIFPTTTDGLLCINPA